MASRAGGGRRLSRQQLLPVKSVQGGRLGTAATILLPSEPAGHGVMGWTGKQAPKRGVSGAARVAIARPRGLGPAHECPSDGAYAFRPRAYLLPSAFPGAGCWCKKLTKW